MNKSFVNSFYFCQIDFNDLITLKSYFNNIDESDFHLNEFGFDDQYLQIQHKKYRSCEINYPLENSCVYDIGKKIFYDINEKTYEYDLSGFFEFQLIRYFPGGNYNWHCDYGTSMFENMDRKLSISIQLSDSNEYEGGELVLVDYGNHHVEVPKESGTAIIFDSRVPHKANPVIKGQRNVLVGWASGPKLR